MNTKISGITSRVAKWSEELDRAFEQAFANKCRALGCGTCAGPKQLCQGIGTFLWDAPVASLLVAPVIYSLIVPFILLDFWLWLYQTLCFPIYKIDKVDRSRHMLLDRGHLEYLNWIERLNCNYCGYVNGLIAYVREIASRTEQYFCPIKHARRSLGPHSRYHEFLGYGDAAAYQERLAKFRAGVEP